MHNGRALPYVVRRVPITLTACTTFATKLLFSRCRRRSAPVASVSTPRWRHFVAIAVCVFPVVSWHARDQKQALIGLEVGVCRQLFNRHILCWPPSYGRCAREALQSKVRAVLYSITRWARKLHLAESTRKLPAQPNKKHNTTTTGVVNAASSIVHLLSTEEEKNKLRNTSTSTRLMSVFGRIMVLIKLSKVLRPSQTWRTH